MTLTVAQQTALEQRSVPIAYFVKLELETQTLYVSNFNRTYTWGGQDWIGLGQIGSISEIKSSDSADPNAVSLNINIANLTFLTIGVGEVEEYRGRPVSIYMCPLDAEYNLIDTPVKTWGGSMDVLALTADTENSGITMRCEPSAKRLRRRSPLRANHAQQQARYPQDLGFEYLQDLIANPRVWLTKEAQIQFQSQ